MRTAAHVARAATLFVAASVCGCATYPERAEQGVGRYRAGDFEGAVASFEDSDVTTSEFLAGAEVGMIRLTAGDWEAARIALASAAEAAREAEEKSALSLTDGAETLGTLLLNDTTQTYVGEGYERVLVHTALAIAYLGLGQYEGMRVETKRANEVLETEEKLYETSYAAGGMGHMLSALAYEMEGRLDEALIDYRRMVEKGVGLELAGPRLRALADLFEREDLADLVAPYESYTPEGATATVWVIGGMGLAPFKREASLNLPTPVGFVRLTAPQYASRSGAGLLRLVLPDQGETHTCSVIEDVDAIARENLDDRLGWIAARTVARAAIRATAREVVRDQHGELAAFGVDILSLALERADTRSWLTLPREWQALRVPLVPGEHTLELETTTGADVRIGRFELEAGETMIVFARYVDGLLHVHPLGGKRLDPLAVSATGAPGVP